MTSTMQTFILPDSYGGIYERGSREYTLDDFYSLQLDKMERYVCLKESGVVISERDEESSSDDDDDDDDDKDEEEEEDGEDEDDADADDGVGEEGGNTERHASEIDEDAIKQQAGITKVPSSVLFAVDQ
jgi:hypothetical protein